MLQGFLVVLAIYLAAVAVVVVNVGRSRMAVTAECIKVRLLVLLLYLLSPALKSLFKSPCPALPCPALHCIICM